jgi:hypothetical protein
LFSEERTAHSPCLPEDRIRFKYLRRVIFELEPTTEALMELKPQYKVISGAPVEIEQMLNLLSKDGWHPVTMASLALPSVIAVILENKSMEEASLTVTTALRETMTDEVQ